MLVTDAAGVRRIVLNRPHKHNALNASMMNGIAEAAISAQAAGSGIVVISGHPSRNFCAGADLAEVTSADERRQKVESAIHHMAHALEALPLPIVVLAHGKALGAGAILLALADFTLAADDLGFGFPEIGLYLYPVFVHGVLMQKLSNPAAFQLCGTGRILNAAEARDLGLVTEIFPAGTFASDAESRIAEFASRRIALGIGKRAALCFQPPGLLAQRLAALEPLMAEAMQHAGTQGLQGKQ